MTSKKIFVLSITELILGLNCLVGDYFIFKNDTLIRKISELSGFGHGFIRALMDNGSHGFIGFLSWFVVIYPNIDVNQLIISGLISSFIDVDHFISARSFKLQDVTSLSQRPFLHNSLLLIGLNVSVIFLHKKFSVLFFVSWFSHHIRDGNRRGLWFGPLYTTQPMNDSLYYITILITPLLIRYFYFSNIWQNNGNFYRILSNLWNSSKNLEEIQLV